MGRKKLKIEKLEKLNTRQATFGKRNIGLRKKAVELSILCDICVLLLMFSPTGKAYLYSAKQCFDELLKKFSKITPKEITKRMLESIEALKKTFLKLGHHVNIPQFLDRRRSLIHYQKLQSQREKARSLRKVLSEMKTKLSYWKNIEKIDNVDVLHQLENSIKQSLAQIRAHKENIRQQQLRSLEWENKLQNVTDIDSAMERQQQLEKFSRFSTDENMNVPPLEEGPTLQIQQLKMDMTNTSLSLRTYSVVSGNSSKIYPDLDDPKLQQLPKCLLPSRADYCFRKSGGLETWPHLGENDWASSEMLPYHVAVVNEAQFLLQQY